MSLSGKMQITNFATFSVIEAQGYLQGKRQAGTAAGRIRKIADKMKKRA